MKKLFLVVLFFLPLCIFAEVIDIDGSFSDWQDITTGVADYQDITGTWYYYDGDSWDVTCATSCISVNQEQLLDIRDFKITNTTDYLYLYFNTSEPLGAVKTTTDTYVSREPYGVPAAYDHWLIIGFDATGDDEYDYYYAINIKWDASGDGFPSSDPIIYLYQDDGDGVFSLADTLLSTLEDSDFNWAIDTVNYEPKMEVQLNLDQFIENTSINRSDDLTIKLFTDESLGEITNAFAYNIQDAENLNKQNAELGANNVKATSAVLWWKEVAGASQYQVQLRLADDTFIDNYYYLELTRELTGLNPNTAYIFRTRAQINDVWQDWTDYYAFQTLPDRPANVKISNKRADKITVSWDAASGNITQYQVNLYNLKYKVLRSVTTQNNSVTFSNLKPYKRYRIKVRAYNDSVVSKYSKIKRFKTARKKFYLKIKDLSTENLDYNTPGADIDAVSMVRNNYNIYYAESVVRSKILVGTGDRGNDCDDPNAALGMPDKVFVSLGGRGGFIVLKFNKALNYRAQTLTVRELGGGTDGGFAEPYQVYISAHSRGPWKSVGTGIGETEFNL